MTNSLVTGGVEGLAPSGQTPKILKIAITGEFRRGKDTVADIIQAVLLREGGSVSRLAFADALKYELAEMVFGYGATQNYTDLSADYDAEQLAREGFHDLLVKMRDERQLNGTGWQWWGEYRRQVEGADYWVNHPFLTQAYQSAIRHSRNIIITDMRHHNENKWCRENGFFMLRVEGPCRAEGETRLTIHPSEIHVKDLEVNSVIYNHERYTLEELEQYIRHELMPTIVRHSYRIGWITGQHG